MFIKNVMRKREKEIIVTQNANNLPCEEA